MKVKTSVHYIICTTQITLKFILAVYKGWFSFHHTQVVNYLFASENWLQFIIDFPSKVRKLSANPFSRFLILERYMEDDQQGAVRGSVS